MRKNTLKCAALNAFDRYDFFTNDRKKAMTLNDDDDDVLVCFADVADSTYLMG